MTDSITKTTKSPAGTCLKGEMTCAYSDLVRALGEPTSSDGYKVSSEWVVEFRGRVFTVYDYKSTSLYDSECPTVEEFRALPEYDWHIGGSAPAGDFIEALSRMVSK